jgi:uncharacterized repeat protein (TIGR04076 family)
MAEMFDVEVSVVSQKGNCGAGHKVGDNWIIKNTTPAGICLSAYQVLDHNIDILKYGGKYPWSKDEDSCEIVCPDPANPVVFKLRRIKE